MKFTVDRIALERMIQQLKTERGVPGAQQRILRLSACAARVFVEANGVTAGVEALVLEDGSCNLPRMKLLKVLQTFHPKPNITVTADAGGLLIEGFLMRATNFSPIAAAPGEFQVFPVSDAWLAPSETPKATPPPESRWLKTRWWQ